MSTLTPSRPRHLAPSPPLSRSTWLRVRRTLTGGLFAAATVAGVVVGLQGAAVSPVASVAPVATPAAGQAVPGPVPVPVRADVIHHDRGPHR